MSLAEVMYQKSLDLPEHAAHEAEFSDEHGGWPRGFATSTREVS